MKTQPTVNGVTIDKSIPLPGRRGRGAPKYPWTELEIGDSFLLEQDGVKTAGSIGYANIKHAPKHFVQRKTAEGFRIWRDK